MNIYDCFMYYDEDMILELRLNILNNHVKKFIITESIYNHNGKERKLKFDVNNFKQFKDKIDYIVIEDLPHDIEIINNFDSEEVKNSKILTNALKRENYQRNMLSHGIEKALEDDLIIISDVDEIPNLESFSHNNKITFFEQKMFYYKFNLKHPDIRWVGSRACKKKFLESPQWIRNIKDKSYSIWRLDTLFSKKKYSNINYIKNGGWHFTSVKSPEEIHFKLSNFLHHLEYNNSGLGIDNLKDVVANKKVLYDHKKDKREDKWKSSISLVKVLDEELPSFLIENKAKYKEWFD